MIALSLLIFAAGSAFASSSFAPVLIPIGVALVGLYALDLLRSTMVLAGYKQWLEEQFNELAERPVLLWDSCLSTDLNTRTRGKAGVFALFFGVVALGSVVSCWSALHYSGPYGVWIQITVLVFWPFYFLIAISSGIEGRRAKSMAYDWAKRCDDPADEKRRYFRGRRRPPPQQAAAEAPVR